MSTKKAPAGIGSNPPTYRFNPDFFDNDEPHYTQGATKKTEGDTPVPWWFNPSTAKLFHKHLSVEEDDIIVSSGVKMGTTWLTNLLACLLYEYDDYGNLIPQEVENRHKIPGRMGQTYPDALYPNREEQDKDRYNIYKRMPEGSTTLARLFGGYVYEDVLNQPRPRMIVTHMFGQRYLPKGLFDECDHKGNSSSNAKRRMGKGRLIVVARNLKDTLVSLHNFRGTAMDGWFGNEHGPGSYNRSLMLEDCPNALGSSFYWVRENAKAVKSIGSERALVVYYESLILNFDAQLQRINTFLGLPTLTKAKANAVKKACSFESMAGNHMRTQSNCRKGGICGWKDVVELTDEHWDKFDRTFSEVLSGHDMVEPMRFFMWKDIPGIPPMRLKKCTLDTDPREWPPYVPVVLKDGMVLPDPRIHNDGGTTVIHSNGQFKSEIRPGRYLRIDETSRDGSPRFHIFVAGSCPLDSSVAATRTILGLETLLSMDTADGQSGGGWLFLEGATCSPWKDRSGPFYLHEAYQLVDPLCTTNIDVPLLFDTELHKIISNDAFEIMKLLSNAACDLGLSCPKNVQDAIAKHGDKNDTPTLFPDSMASCIEKMITGTVKPLLGAFTDSGFEFLSNGNVKTPHVQEGYTQVYKILDKLEEFLATRQCLMGNRLTGADVPLALFFIQFDACYCDVYQLKSSEGYKGPIVTGNIYPNLKSYTRNVYQLLKPAVRFESFRQLYRLGQAIEFSHQLYSTSTNTDKVDATGVSKELPDLNEIIRSLEASV